MKMKKIYYAPILEVKDTETDENTMLESSDRTPKKDNKSNVFGKKTFYYGWGDDNETDK